MNEEMNKVAYDAPTTEREVVNESIDYNHAEEARPEAITGRGYPAGETAEDTDIAIEAAEPAAEPEGYGDVIGTPSNFGSTRDVKITPLSSGFLVKVGCQSVAVETNERLVDMLGKYVNDPQGFESKWYSKDVRNRLENI